MLGIGSRAAIFIIFITVTIISAFSTLRYTSDQCISACSNLINNLTNDYDVMVCSQCSRNPPLTNQMCQFSCDNVKQNMYHFMKGFYKICQVCVVKAQLTAPMCIHACDSTVNPQYLDICLRCQENPPITGLMCIHACDNTAYSWYASICDICSIEPPPVLCRYACRNKTNPKYQQICTSKICS